MFFTKPKSTGQEVLKDSLERHFRTKDVQRLVTASRSFSATVRVDLQRALEKLFSDEYESKLIGVFTQHSHETITYAGLVTDVGYGGATVGPLHYDEVDVGEVQPVRCLQTGLWLSKADAIPFAVLISQHRQFGGANGTHLEIIVAAGDQQFQLTRRFLDSVARIVSQAASYRGKVLSLEAANDYSGKAGSVKVHRLQPVDRKEVILPERTLRLLEQNITEFIKLRDRLKDLKMSVKKGLLFYGPPGTGKTHTIRYLASQLQDHTTLLITAEQVGLLDEYFQLARFLQPVLLVIEDVDLIARAREAMKSPCEETVLNKLLNEMDGLREEAMVLFILTTNHPEQLETALASRPGRIDQAVEFPLPDEAGRRKLVQLYARGLNLDGEVVELVVSKTNRASGAFIKELMRRAAQYQLREGHTGDLLMQHVEAAMDEMLFAGGSFNAKLLGAGASECLGFQQSVR